MYNYLKTRILLEAEYIIENKATVRSTAKVFGIGKSTVHKDMVLRLKEINTDLYYKVKDILQTNLQERHIRGGLATKRKYTKLKD
ncbi:MAG: sporulation transcriptional regulator SpoIIID [Clostridia bacterium]|nr:sporulation transcriptional regulator SpoIIID [Clostridia bacterium]